MTTGSEALTMAVSESYDVLIVDRMLPGLDGLTLVKALRGARVNTPVLFLTALDGSTTAFSGLTLAATTIL